MEPRERFYPEIESLRGIAALTVVAHHCFIVPVVRIVNFPANPMPLDSAADFFTLIAAAAFPGQSAVPLFFVISGFVLSIGLPRHPVQAMIEWPGFALRRVFRIFPAMWLSVLLGAIAFIALHQTIDFPALLRSATFWSYDLNPPLWTLRVEFFLSLLLPLLFVLSAPRGAFGIAINVALQVFFWWRTASQDPTLQFAAFFHLGLLVPTAGKRLIALLTERQVWSFAIGAVAIIAFCSPFAYSLYFRPNLYTELLYATALPSFLFVSHAAFGTGRIRTALNTAAARSLGRISYSLYILHFPIMTVFMTWEIDHLKPYPHVAGEVLLFVLTLAVTLPAAYLSYRYVERPGVRLGHLASDKITALARRLRSPQSADGAFRAQHPL